MQPHEQAQFLSAVGTYVREQIELAIAPLRQRVENLVNADDKWKTYHSELHFIAQENIERIDKTIAERFDKLVLPKDGKDGQDGKDGKDGKDGAAGLNGEPGMPGLDGPPGVPGKDGQDGRDGADGKSVALDDLAAVIDSRIAETVSKLPVPRHIVGGFIDRSGDLHVTYSDGVSARMGQVVGQDCDMVVVAEQVAREIQKIVSEWPKPKDGKDGLGFDDLRVEEVDERTLKFVFQNGDRFKEFNIYRHGFIDKGIWKAGKYERGDAVTLGGSLFIAQCDTDKKPGESEDWRLAVKRGQDGKDGQRGARGEPGKQGPAGQDLRSAKWG
jgi:Collagen triple helix repeat (20 copies)